MHLVMYSAGTASGSRSELRSVWLLQAPADAVPAPLSARKLPTRLPARMPEIAIFFLLLLMSYPLSLRRGVAGALDQRA